ncbi:MULTISPECIES: ParA family protein [Ramlibacter]|uniref:ParA family protein n=1 Tax=Ramlibacter aquaticus TaxID=2780094 RepID=A0ABR9SCN4_9BURK|nr:MULTISPECIES: ParA family protein [Ramlibacter]MBE7940118.1 ParA family protein [Ramlibacter aquaticus]
MTALAIYSSKGGSGKSTVSIHLAVAAGEMRRTVLIDADPQRTVMMWAANRALPQPQVLASDPSGIEDALRRIAVDRQAVAIVDCPPHSVAGTARLLAAVDHIVIPVQPTMPDLAATQRAMTMVKAAGKPFSFVLSRVPVRSAEAAQALKILDGFGPTVPSVIHDRRAFARALIESSAVTEVRRLDHLKAANEIRAVWEWLQQKIKELDHVEVKSRFAAVC